MKRTKTPRPTVSVKELVGASMPIGDWDALWNHYDAIREAGMLSIFNDCDFIPYKYLVGCEWESFVDGTDFNKKGWDAGHLYEGHTFREELEDYTVLPYSDELVALKHRQYLYYADAYILNIELDPDHWISSLVKEVDVSKLLTKVSGIESVESDQRVKLEMDVMMDGKTYYLQQAGKVRLEGLLGTFDVHSDAILFGDTIYMARDTCGFNIGCTVGYFDEKGNCKEDARHIDTVLQGYMYDLIDSLNDPNYTPSES